MARQHSELLVDQWVALLVVPLPTARAKREPFLYVKHGSDLFTCIVAASRRPGSYAF